MSNLIKNDSQDLWSYFSKLKDGRVDIVFDNSGFEVFADLVFADWMVTKTPFVKAVHLHPKTIRKSFLPLLTPSEPCSLQASVQPGLSRMVRLSIAQAIVSQSKLCLTVINGLDIDDMFEGLEELKGQVTDEQRGLVESLIKRWQGYFANGTFQLSTPSGAQIGDDAPLANFWCGPFDFPRLPKEDPALLAELQKSDLVIFKGDLNYRKLTSDATVRFLFAVLYLYPPDRP